MAFYARKPEREYSPAPQGLWPAVCVDVVDKGLVRDQWGDKYIVQLRWELEQIDPETDPKRPYMAVQKFTNSMHEKAKLRLFLEAWRGRKFDNDKEAYAFDFDKLIGVNCQLSIVHNIAGGGDVYANVVAIVGPVRNGIKLRPSPDYIRARDRKDKGTNGRQAQAPQHTYAPLPNNPAPYDPFNDDQHGVHADQVEQPVEITDEDIPF